MGSNSEKKPEDVSTDFSTNWHLELFSKSILKQAKFANLLKGLGTEELQGEEALDLGSDNGVISFKLRELGGVWSSADLTDEVVESTRQLVGERVFKLESGELPFVDLLEHVENDGKLVSEIHRILKKDGQLLVNAPNLKKGSFLRLLRNLIGQTDEKHGHLRPGYDKASLAALTSSLFELDSTWTYSGFFTEFIDTALVFGVGALKKVSSLLSGSGKSHSENDSKKESSRETTGEALDSSANEKEVSKGLVLTAEGISQLEKQFKIYSLIYPAIKLFSSLDRFLYPFEGYMRLSVFKKT